MEDNIKQRLISFINSKNISTREFERNCNLSNGYINSMKKGMGIEKLENVLHFYSELNKDWLLTGKGKMIKDSTNQNKISEPNTEYGKNIDYKDKYYELLEKYYQLNEEIKQLKNERSQKKKHIAPSVQDVTA